MGNTAIKTKGQNCCRLSRTLGRIVDQAPLRSTNIKTITATSLSNSTKRKINLFNRIHLPIKLVSNTKFRTRCTKTRNKNSSVQCGNLTQLLSQGFNDRIGSKPTQNLCGNKDKRYRFKARVRSSLCSERDVEKRGRLQNSFD